MNICKILACPLCGGEMSRDGGRLLCENGHSYDVASAGYVNLLPPGKKNNAGTGDDKAMVRARIDFLDKGYYDGISLGMADAIKKTVKGDTAVIADIGCGEGHHTCRIAEGIKGCYDKLTVLGVDASGYAVGSGQKLAVRRGLAPKGGVGTDSDSGVLLGFTAGNIFHLPMKDSSADCMLSMFAPIPWEECRRVLKPGGAVIVAASGRDHLLELRETIYEAVIKKEPSPSPGEGFELCERSSVKYKIHLPTGEDIMSLFDMTPFKYKTTPAAEARLREKDSLSVTAEVEYFVFGKRI